MRSTTDEIIESHGMTDDDNRTPFALPCALTHTTASQQHNNHSTALAL